MVKGSMESGRAVGTVRKNTLGWVSKDKYSLLSAAYNLFDLRQATTEGSSKKKNYNWFDHEVFSEKEI